MGDNSDYIFEMDTDLVQVEKFLNKDEIILPTDPMYVEESRTWAAQKDLKPRIVARPKSLGSLCKLVAWLEKTDLDFAVRSGGCGSSSARDILISMTAFNSFEFDATTKTATFGTGQTWHEVEKKLEEVGPGHAVISTRSSFCGVGGSLFGGGLSWMSSENGLAIDPGNLLDAQIVKADGTAVFASAEPDLLWALRGGGGSFGIVTCVRVKVYDYPHSIFSGRVIYPRSALEDVAREVAAFATRSSDPKMCLHLYCLSIDLGLGDQVTGEKSTASVAIMFYDANGEEHGRSEDGFAWALKIPGAKPMIQNSSTFRQMNTLGDDMKNAMGCANSHLSGITIPTINEGLILRAWKWFDDLLEAAPAIADVPMGIIVLIELMQKAAIHSDVPRTDCAWPHTPNQHVLQLGVAAPPDSPDVEKIALKALEDAPKQICIDHKPADYLPNIAQAFNDPKEIYGVNYEKLVRLKKRYDPRGRFKGIFSVDP